MIHKRDVARALDEIGRYLKIEERNRFRSKAYINAARAVDSLPMSIQDFVASEAMQKTPGIGKATGQAIEELVRTGTSRYLEELRAKYPPGIFELLRIPGLGLRKIGMLYSELGISSVDELQAAVAANKLTSLRGFGAKTQEKIGQSIEFYRSHQTQFLLPAAMRVADMVRDHVAAMKGVENVEISGSIRRRLEVVGNVNLCVSGKDLKRLAADVEAIDFLHQARRLDDQTIEAQTRMALPVLFHLCKPRDLASRMFFTTGSATFIEAVVEQARRRKIDLSSTSFDSEEEIFKSTGLPWVEPELREDPPADWRNVPRRLVDYDDLRGTFHVHSTYSDGKATIPEMLESAAKRGFQYVGLSDHSPTASYAGGLTLDRLERQHAEIEENRSAFKDLRIFLGTESDILPNGELDYPPEILARLDFVIASVHSRFRMNREEMTERILRAVANPFTTILGHLTGRLLLSREGYTLDFDAIFAAAAEHEVLIEINGSPYRLDIDWRLIQRAVGRGVRLVINPDAHSVAEMNYLVSGTWVARKGGLTPDHVFNTRSLAEVERYLKARRSRAISRSGVRPVRT